MEATDTEVNADNVQVGNGTTRDGDGAQVCGGVAHSANPRYWRRWWSTQRLQWQRTRQGGGGQEGEGGRDETTHLLQHAAQFQHAMFRHFFFLFLSAWFCFFPEALKMEAIFKAPTWYMHSKQKAETRPWASEWKTKQKNNNNYIHKFQHCNFFVFFSSFLPCSTQMSTIPSVDMFHSHTAGEGIYQAHRESFFFPVGYFAEALKANQKGSPTHNC